MIIWYKKKSIILYLLYQHDENFNANINTKAIELYTIYELLEQNINRQTVDNLKNKFQKTKIKDYLLLEIKRVLALLV